MRTKLNGYDVPGYFVSMSHEKRKEHVMKILLNDAMGDEYIISDDDRRMAASLRDKDIDNFVFNIDSKRKLQLVSQASTDTEDKQI